ncbi:MAG: hypothetical protein U9Q30_00460 [Campylobacterota bacterium]|nr:hypothetical protein [Campylobacterota bacterium]
MVKNIFKFITKYISAQTLFVFIGLSITAIIGLISMNIYDIQTSKYKEKIYVKLNHNITDQFNLMLKEKINISLMVSSSLSKDPSIKKALLTKNKKYFNTDKILGEIRTNHEYRDIEAELIDKKGISIKRSWTKLAGDDLVKNDFEMEHLLKYPIVNTKIESSKFGLTISNKIPIFNEDKFLGLFVVNMHFDALTNIFISNDYHSVLLLNKRKSRKISQNLSYSKEFIGGYYVINKNMDSYYLKVIEQIGVDKLFEEWEKNYIVNKENGNLINKVAIKSIDINHNETVIANAFIFKSIDHINFEDLDFFQRLHMGVTIAIVLLLILIVNYIVSLKRNHTLEIEAEELRVKNEELNEKTENMDFNDKKLDNLFNMQPNLMMMHNGKDVTKANKRFMGFFNRFKTFEGFRQKHNCVSELFEDYQAPNYISSSTIEGIFWVDYILKNPRRLYKTVMSIENRQGIWEQHHFIIKLNEMEYAQYVSDRVIIIALVDMTQDLPNYKTLDMLKEQPAKPTPKVTKKVIRKINKKEESA